VVLARLNRAQDDKGRMTVCDLGGRLGKGVAAKEGRNGRWGVETLGTCESGKIIERGLTVPDDSVRGAQYGEHPRTVSFLLAGPAEFGMSQRNEIVHEVNWANVGFSDPSSESWFTQASVSHIQIETAVTGSAPQPRRSRLGEQLSSKIRRRFGEKIKQPARGFSIQDSAHVAMLHHGLCTAAVMFHVS